MILSRFCLNARRKCECKHIALKNGDLEEEGVKKSGKNSDVIYGKTLRAALFPIEKTGAPD